ncbi:hypothetical protein [Nonomuraea sp. NPDC049646]|uniref:hypothetical protein n=1 Tax=unclassified Nonomuraea TaxID=2593643 RepID=UPI003791D32F
MALALGTALAIVSCGAEQASPATRYAASLTVLEGGGHGPQLCSMVAESMPPQCGGPDVIGWDWSRVAHESANGVRWGRYRVVGTWDGSRLTLTAPPGAPEQSSRPDRTPPSTPCSAPAGGWSPVEPAKATRQALENALRRAREAEDFAGAWIDQNYSGPPPTTVADFEARGDDPRRLILDVTFTGDPARRERWLREVWGGALCVGRARHTYDQLRSIQGELEREAGFVSVAVDESANRVTAGVWVAGDDLRDRLDERYGEQTVAAEAILRPVD